MLYCYNCGMNYYGLYDIIGWYAITHAFWLPNMRTPKMHISMNIPYKTLNIVTYTCTRERNILLVHYGG